MNLELKFEILKKFRTQADFSIAVKEHETFVSQVLMGRRKLTPEKAETWKKALECDSKIITSLIKD